jgi:hypothetical protein
VDFEEYGAHLVSKRVERNQRYMIEKTKKRVRLGASTGTRAIIFVEMKKCRKTKTLQQILHAEKLLNF